MAKEDKKYRGVYEYPRGSGIWWVCYFDKYGKRHREKVGMKSTAISVYQQRKTEIRQSKFEPEDIKRKHQNATVKEIINDYLTASEAAGRKSIRDIKQRSLWWIGKLGDKSAKSIVQADIEKLRLELSGSKAPGRRHKGTTKPRAIATVNRYLDTLKASFLMAMENDKVERNPFRKIRKSKEENERMRYLSNEEEMRLFKALPKEYHPMVTVALNTGMRQGEQLTLKWEDVDFKNRIITVHHSKSGKKRYIPMNPWVVQTLQALPHMIGCPYVFYTSNGERRKQLPKGWEAYLANAKIQNFTWHDLRHTFASRLVMKGVPLYTVQGLLGHSTAEMTKRYAHLAPEYMANSVDLLCQGIELPPELPLAHISA